MPMEHISTPELQSLTDSQSERRQATTDDTTPGPKQITLMLLQQFARCYIPVESVPGSFTTLMAN